MVTRPHPAFVRPVGRIHNGMLFQSEPREEAERRVPVLLPYPFAGPFDYRVTPGLANHQRLALACVRGAWDK